MSLFIAEYFANDKRFGFYVKPSSGQYQYLVNYIPFLKWNKKKKWKKSAFYFHL